MILRSPSELYLLHLLVHPANHTIDQVIERAIETKTVFVLQCRWRRNGVTVGGAEMAAWVRERTRSCPGRRAGATLA